MVIDRSLALACELGEREGLRRCMEAGQRNFPELGIEEGVAIGIESHVSADVVDEISEFFRSRHCPARVTVAPITNPNLAPLLARAGYEPVECQNTLIADVSLLDGYRDERIIEMRDPRQWARPPATHLKTMVPFFSRRRHCRRTGAKDGSVH